MADRLHLISAVHCSLHFPHPYPQRSNSCCVPTYKKVMVKACEGQGWVGLPWAYSIINPERADAFQTAPATVLPPQPHHRPMVPMGVGREGDHSACPHIPQVLAGCDAVASLAGCFPCWPADVPEMSCAPFHQTNTASQSERQDCTELTGVTSVCNLSRSFSQPENSCLTPFVRYKSFTSEFFPSLLKRQLQRLCSGDSHFSPLYLQSSPSP